MGDVLSDDLSEDILISNDSGDDQSDVGSTVNFSKLKKGEWIETDNQKRTKTAD